MGTTLIAITNLISRRLAIKTPRWIRPQTSRRYSWRDHLYVLDFGRAFVRGSLYIPTTGKRVLEKCFSSRSSRPTPEAKKELIDFSFSELLRIETVGDSLYFLPYCFLSALHLARVIIAPSAATPLPLAIVSSTHRDCSVLNGSR